MALIDIEYGSLASSETLNKNFKFLQNSISDFSQVIETNKASLESQISTFNTNITNKLDSKIEELKFLELPKGTILPMLQSETKLNGFLLCDGSSISRTTYSELFSIIKETYGEGDGSTTFNIPDLRNRVVQGAPSITNFGYIGAGLPNIIGTVSIEGTTGTGAFSSWSTGRNPGGSGQGGYYGMSDFNASRCSSIYGSSNTVQPPAMKVNFFIKY